MVERMKKDTKIVITILIAIILVFGVFYLVVYMYTLPPYSCPMTPSIVLTATPGNTSCVIVVNSPSHNDTLWSDVWYVLSNLTGQKEHNDSQVTIPRDGVINEGDIIYISGGLAEDNEYRFVIYSNITGGTVGYYSWTQQTKKISEIDRFVGTWESSQGNTLIFFSNGTGMLFRIPAIWELNEGKLFVNYTVYEEGFPLVYDYVFSENDSTLEITSVDTGFSTIFNKQ